MDDHYEVLGLERTASAEEIKRAFRELALRYHPDQHPSPIANALFRRIHEAYTVLFDPETRRRYDQALRERDAGPRPTHAPPDAREGERQEAP